MKNTRTLIQTTIFVALMVAGAYIRIPSFLPYVPPFTLQTLFALMAGIVLGEKNGPLSQVIYIFLGLVGLPVFAQAQGGFGAVVSPTFGFLLGFILGAFFSGFLYRSLPIQNRYLRASISTFIGALSVYLMGIPYFYGVMNLYLHKPLSIFDIIILMTPFILPDIAKALTAGFIGVILKTQLINRQLIEKE